LNVR
jgi:hypothetical protein